MINVVPVNDELEHVHDFKCWCEPKTIWQDERGGEIYERGPIVVHNSADCRESVERLLGEGFGWWAVFED